MLSNCTALAVAAFHKPFGTLMYLHNSCAWLGSFVRQATTEAAATETAKVTPIALFMSFSCRHTPHTDTQIIHWLPYSTALYIPCNAAIDGILAH